jgi:hypothetical protein
MVAAFVLCLQASAGVPCAACKCAAQLVQQRRGTVKVPQPPGQRLQVRFFDFDQINRLL